MQELGRQADISDVVLFAALYALLAMAILLFDAGRRGAASRLPGRLLLGALSAFVVAAAGLEVGAKAPFAVSAALVVGGALGGLAAARAALLSLFGRDVRLAPAAPLVLAATAIQVALADRLGGAGLLVLTSSMLNGPLAAVFGVEVWRAARAQGFDAPALVVLPFAGISAAYLARLVAIATGAGADLLLTLSAGIAYALSVAGVAWVFGLTAIEAFALRRRLEWGALHDHLTGLRNRAALDADFGGRRETDGVAPGDACLAIDLDGFKAINDGYGHPAGDAVLRIVAGRLAGLAEERGARVYRLGGDEFVMRVPSGAAGDVTEFAIDLCFEIARPIPLEGRIFSVNASVGIAVVRPAEEAGDVLRRADAALYAVKDDGGGGVLDCSELGRDGNGAASRA